ncbi:MAG: crosslink repair DNA glycosylase YcaQ family protein [Lactococcus raffinolactis]
MTDIIFSKQDIRRYMIHHFGLDRLDAYGEGKSGVLTYIKQVASLQQDPINIIGTNIDIILASRFSDYSPQVLTELLYQDELLIEGFDKEACLFSRDEWGQFAFARDQRVAANLRTLSYRDQDKALDYLEEVTNLLQNSSEPVSPQDLNLGRLADSSWGSSNLGNTVLYHLWCQGVAVIAERKERRKLYKHYKQAKGLANLLTFDSETDFLDWFVYRRLSGLGVYWLKSGSGWLGQSMKERKANIERFLEQGKVVKIQVTYMKEALYLTQDNYQRLLVVKNQPIKADQVRFIAPFDNFIWDRKFVQAIFDFEYVWEVYKPEKLRQYGYYVLPILLGDNFIGRFEPDRTKTRQDTLKIKKIWFESNIYETPEMTDMILTEVERYNQLLLRK